MSRTAMFLLTCVWLALTGCSKPEPIRIGFIGGLSDRNSDTGQAGLHGVTLAIEECNRTGCVNGRFIELIPRDDAQNADVARQSAEQLRKEGVQAVIGPFTSSMAEVIVPVLAQDNLLVVSPTITSMDFYGKDDNLVRINRTTRDNAHDYAQTLVSRGQRRIAVAYDLRNRNFTESWLAEFKQAMSDQGGRVITAVSYTSAPNTDFDHIVRDMLQERPDSLFYIAGAMDVARLAQASRKQAPKLPIGASEWAATEQLLELGGQVVEGLLIVQSYNRDDDSARYREFAEAYFQRFQRTPGYTSVAAYDAATVLLTALRQHTTGSLKATLVRNGPYQGLQQVMTFDANGDTPRRVFFTEIHNGQYVRVN